MVKQLLLEIKRFKLSNVRILSLSRISNVIHAFFERFSLGKVAKAYPMVVMIEPTNNCNLRCPMCPAVIENSIGIRPDMSLELFNKVVDNTSRHAFYLALWNYGEPLMNPNIKKMLKSASSKKFIVEMHTNGQLLNSFSKKVFAQKPSEISDYLPNKMSISVDSINEETYRFYRKGGELSVLKKNIREFILKRNELKLTKPRVATQFILMKNNAEEIENTNEVKKFVDELKVDDYTIKFFSYRGNDIEEHLPDKENLRLTLKKQKNSLKPCLRPWISTVILSNGTVLPCCYDYSNEWSMGNIKENSFEEIWNDTPYQNFRAMLLSGKVPKICVNCPGHSFGSLFKN